MQRDYLAVLTHYATLLFPGAKPDLAEMQDRGWVDENGCITSAGKDAAQALIDQSGTRTALRVG